MNIGLLEDDPSIAEIYTFALEAQGHTVFWHTTGNSLLQALLEKEKPRTPLPYQLLLVDLLLPGGFLVQKRFSPSIGRSIPLSYPLYSFQERLLPCWRRYKALFLPYSSCVNQLVLVISYTSLAKSHPLFPLVKRRCIAKLHFATPRFT